MSSKLKIFTVSTLLAMVVALVGGVVLASSHAAWGTFLWAIALMLGPFAGVALFIFAAVIAVTVLQKSLSAAGGVLLLASVGLMLFTPVGFETPLMYPMFVAGGLLGAWAVGLVRVAGLGQGQRGAQ